MHHLTLNRRLLPGNGLLLAVFTANKSLFISNSAGGVLCENKHGSLVVYTKGLDVNADPWTTERTLIPVFLFQPCWSLTSSRFLSFVRFSLASGVQRSACSLCVLRWTSALQCAVHHQETPEAAPVPYYDDHLTPFERLLLVRCLREDRTMLAAAPYIKTLLGPEYMDPQPLDLKAVVSEAGPATPLLFLLSHGADPTGSIEGLAKRCKKQLQTISMGQGQEEAAAALVQTAFRTGNWILLQNCHLGLRFLMGLEVPPLSNGPYAPAPVHVPVSVWVDFPAVLGPRGLCNVLLPSPSCHCPSGCPCSAPAHAFLHVVLWARG